MAVINQKISMENWVRRHSINGPSFSAYKNIRRTEIQLFYVLNDDAWVILDSLDAKQRVKKLNGKYYVVFKEELNNLINSKA